MFSALLAAVLVLRGGTCVDAAARVTPQCEVVIDGVAAGSTIDVRGRWIVPPFVDNHVHLGRIKPDPEMWLRAGVLRLVENGSDVAPAELARRYARGPHVDACGPILTKRGGYPDRPSIGVSGAADAARRTAQLIRDAKPACIKIAIERGFQADLADSGWPALNKREVDAIVGEARKHRLAVRAHVTQQAEFDLAVNAGVSVIAHVPIASLSNASLRNAAKRNVVIVTTAALWGDGPHRQAAQQNLVRYVRLGGAIAIGSDYPNWPTPGFPIAELRALREAGLTPKELFIALTRNTVSSARSSRDFVVLRADPLSSIDAMTQVEFVIRDGVMIR